MAHSTGSGDSSEQEPKNQDPARPESRQFPGDDIPREIGQLSNSSYGAGQLQPADFNHSVDDLREFKDALEGEIGFPEADTASRDEPPPQTPGAPAHLKKRIPAAAILIAGLLLGLLVLSTALLAIGKSLLAPAIPPTATQPGSQAFPISGPQPGSLMAFGDGSVHVFVPHPDGTDNNGQKGFWISLNPISNYQYSLCVQGGNCQPPPDGDLSGTPRQNSPAGVDGDGQAAYCGWIGGRIPTSSELAAFQDLLQAPMPDAWVPVSRAVLVALGDGSVRGLDTRWHCVMGQPLPMPRFVKTSPYLNPGAGPGDTAPEVLQTGQFCQSGQAYRTVDIKLDEGASIVSVNGDGKTGCQLVNENRVVCYGAPNASLQAQVGFQRDGAQNLRCPIGTEFDGDGCVFPSVPGGASPAGMDDWEYDLNGVLIPVNGVQPPGVQPAEPEDQAVSSRQLPGGGLAGPILQGQVVINGVLVARDSYTPADAPATDCPAGYYLDPGANACLSLGPPQTQCLDGYHFNAEKLGCEADQPGGNYPGCPLGQLLDPFTGQCAANSRMLSLTSVMLVQPLQLNLPECSSAGSGSGPADSGNPPACPPGYTYTCDPVCGCAPP